MKCTWVSSYKECITPRVWNFPDITRPFSIIYYALGGSAFYTIDGREYKFEKGHLYILPANRVFSLREDPHNKFFSVYIHAFTSPEINTVIDIDTKQDAFIKDTLQIVRKYSKLKTDEHDTYIKSLTDMLLSYIFEAAEDTNLVTRLKKYIDKNYVATFKNNSLSVEFNYSASHLSKLFREKYNITPKQYAKQLLLGEAEALLGNGMSVREVSERLEFSSPENFSRFFKGCYGYCPSRYIKRFENFPL